MLGPVLAARFRHILPDMTTALWILAGLLVLVGLAGVILPLLPGVPLVFAGLLLAAWIDGFTKVGWIALTILAILTSASVIVDIVATSLGARRHGASRWAVLGAALGTIVGMFFGVVGLVFGPFAGAVIGELAAGRSAEEARRAAFGTWLGMLVATAVKLALAFAMLGIFALAWLL